MATTIVSGPISQELERVIVVCVVLCGVNYPAGLSVWVEPVASPTDYLPVWLMHILLTFCSKALQVEGQRQIDPSHVLSQLFLWT